MSPNFSRPATALSFRVQARFGFLTLALAALIAVPQVFAAEANSNPPAAPFQHLKISSTLSPGTVGIPYSAVISVSGGDAPYKFQEQNLPVGLALNEQTGGISGTPEVAGNFTFAIWVTDAQGDRGLGWVSLTIANKTNVTISVAPTSVSINSGATAQFDATVSNSSNTAATWTVSQGTISSSGLFTAPTVTANTSVVVTATSVADSTKSATAVVAVVAAASPKVSLEVLFPPTNPNTSDFKAVQQYLMSNPVVAGGNITVEWGMVDQGNGVYDWANTDAEIAPWAAAGKKVNLIVWANSDSTTSPCSNGAANPTGNCGIPSYVWKSLGSSNYTTCVTQYGTQQIPNFLDRAGFQIPYQQFMSAVIQKYGSDPEIGYIRFGLGHGGETYPVTGWNTTTAACGKAFASWGVTVTTWETYLAGMLNYEATLHSTKQLMVGVTPMGAPNTVVPDYVAPLAVPMKVGFGSQGLQQSDITNYPNCTANWCNLFAQFTGQAPLELQTYLQSCPDNSCTTGSLVNLVPFAVSHHATVLEIYYQDWLLAFDPSYPGNSEYGASYAKVLTAAAGTNIQ
jgi:Putative Ig domain